MDDLMDKTSYGVVAMRKFGAVPDGFHIFCSEWLGDKPAEWDRMRVTGAVFVGSHRTPGTTMTTTVTLAEMDAEKSGCAVEAPADVREVVFLPAFEVNIDAIYLKRPDLVGRR